MAKAARRLVALPHPDTNPPFRLRPGTVSAFISGHEAHDEMMVVGGDMKAAMKLSAKAMTAAERG